MKCLAPLHLGDVNNLLIPPRISLASEHVYVKFSYVTQVKFELNVLMGITDGLIAASL